MHAENGIAIDVLIAQALERGETDPLYHGIVRKSILEGEATHRAIKLAELAGSPLYIVHLSALEALAEVTNARDEGLNVFAETCPQYLFLDLDDLGNGFEGAKFVCSPRSAIVPRDTRKPCGPDWRPTTFRSCRPITARSASRTIPNWAVRRGWARATSPRSPTGYPGSSIEWS